MSGLQLDIIEKLSKRYKLPLIHMSPKRDSIYFTAILRTDLNIKMGDQILYSTSKTGDLYFAIEQGVNGSKNTYTISSGSTVYPVNLKQKIDTGLYKVEQNPIYKDGYDWFKCEKFEENV